MASVEFCLVLVKEAATVVMRRSTDEELATMAKSWGRAFVHTATADLETAFYAWFDHLPMDSKLATLPPSGAIQVHLTQLFRAREAVRAGREPVGPKPTIRPEFAVAQLAFRAQVEKLGKAEPKVAHKHTKRADGSTDRTGCPECDRIDRVQAAVADLEAKLPAPSAPVRLCPGCIDGRGWVTAKDGTGAYPCRVCNLDQFQRWIGQEMAPDSGQGHTKKTARRAKVSA
jgi:hypothetical protein